MKDKVTGEDTRIPWPGPQPYDEEDWDDFFGRDSKLEELLDRVSVDKLTILLGASGTGKTSLVRAGLVALLRQSRYLRGDGTWPVLLLRRWGALGSSSLEEHLLLQLELAIDAIQNWGALPRQEKAIDDAENLRSDLKTIRDRCSESAGILEVVEELARAQARRVDGRGSAGTRESGIILIFDQFEEQLRSGPNAGSIALQLIGSLFRSKAPTRVLVSMRREYQYALRPLELMVGGLMSRSVFVEPLKAPEVLEVIRESSKSSHLPINGEIADRIVKWLSSETPESADGTVLRDDGSGDRLAEDAQDDRGRPDLLQLQAVLLELCHYARDKGKNSVDGQVFEDFTAQFVAGTDEGLGRTVLNKLEGTTAEELEEELARQVLGGALERWIETALTGNAKRGSRRSQASGRSRSHSEWADMDAENLCLQVNRIAVRLAPRLSSGDYKVAQEENTLFRQALGEDIAKLGLKDPERRARLRIIESDGLPPRLNWNDLGSGDLQGGEESSNESTRRSSEIERSTMLSGLARAKGWSLTLAGDKMLICFRETLHRLATANILQCTFSGSEKGLYWELVHDQFGPSFTKWAERQRGTWDDCKSSMVVCSGLQPIAVPVLEIKPPPGAEFYELDRISWQGCGIENSRSERLTLRRVRFKECYLVGTIFDNVDFVGCSFEYCDLTGVLFRGCHFGVDEDAVHTTFTRCDSNVAIVRSVIEQLEFRDCHLQQPAITATVLEGDVQYTQGCRVIQGFYDVRKGDVSKEVGVSFSADSSASFCTTSKAGSGYVEFPEGVGLHNGKLRDDFRTRQVLAEPTT